MCGACGLSVVAALLLWLAFGERATADARPAAHAAVNQLLETVTVDAGKTTVTTGTVSLKAGTKYELHVSGTFTLANGLGQAFDDDALYCYGDSGFDSPQCQPPHQDANFYIGAGNSRLKEIDGYQEPSGGGTQLGYSISHTYIVDFYPPADGKLTAGGLLAFTHCKSDSTPCTTAINGTMTIQIYGPSGAGGGGKPCAAAAAAAAAAAGKPKCPPVALPTPSAFGQAVTAAAPPPGGTAIVKSPPLGNRTAVDVTVAGLSAGDLAVFAAAARATRHECYVNFTRFLFKVLEAGANSTPKVRADYSAESFVALAGLGEELADCVRFTKAVEAAASGKPVADVATSSCAFAPVTLSLSRSGAKARLRSFKVGGASALLIGCRASSGGLSISLAAKSKGTPLSRVFGSRLGLGIVRGQNDPPGGRLSVAFNPGASTVGGPPNVSGSWVNQAAPISPPWQLTTSNSLQTLDASWTGGAGHTGLRGSFHGSLTKVAGADAYRGTFQVTEAGSTVNGTGSFVIDNANQIEINLTANGGQPQHYVFERTG